MPTNPPLNRKLRMALVGGGQGAFIGRVHATAAVLDNRAALVAGALSSDPARGQGLGFRLRHRRRPGLWLVSRADRSAKRSCRQSERIDFSPWPRPTTRISKSPRRPSTPAST